MLKNPDSSSHLSNVSQESGWLSLKDVVAELILRSKYRFSVGDQRMAFLLLLEY